MTQVLLAEDDPAIAEPLARALSREGYDVVVQGTGQGAVDRASDADLVVLDLRLPDGHGLALVRRLRSRVETAALPIIVITGVGGPEMAVAALDAGANDFIIKPFQPQELLARLRRFLKTPA